jgi:putative sigma-54 modulation protein
MNNAKIEITHVFRGMESSEAVKEYSAKRADKLLKHLHQQINCHFAYSAEKTDFIAVLHVVSGDFDAKAESRQETLYSSIDDVTDKILAQSRKFKELHSAHAGKPHHNSDDSQ